MNELIKLNARQVVELLKKQEVSPLELIDVVADRIGEVEQEVNALPILCLDRAREHARRIMSNLPENPPQHYLYGLPIAIKDLTDVKGVRTTYGSAVFSNHIPDRSDYLVEKGKNLTIHDIQRAELLRTDLYHSTLSFFEQYDLLVCPSTITPPFDVNIRYLEELEGTKFETYISWLKSAGAITLTGCPTISVPCGFTPSGLPVGIQIVGPPRREDRVLSAAAIFEAAHRIEMATPIDPRNGGG